MWAAPYKFLPPGTMDSRFYTHRYAERGYGGMRSPRVAAALPALPEATLLAPLRGALAATRHSATSGRRRSSSRYSAFHNFGGGGGALAATRHSATGGRWWREKSPLKVY